MEYAFCGREGGGFADECFALGVVAEVLLYY